MKKRLITLADWKPTKQQKKLVNQVLRTGRLTYGPLTQELERRFAKLHGKKHAIFMNSGTTALYLALRYFKEKYGWKDEDEIIVPAVTFVATVNVVLLNNLRPVLVDVGKDFNIDPDLIGDALTDRTRAIIPVDLLGQPCKIDKIKRIAKTSDLKIVEDSCETMFVRYKGKPVGSQADIACYSSYFAHIISTGVGGFLTTDDKETERYIRSLIWHGRDDKYLSIDDAKKLAPSERIETTFRFDKIGFSTRLTEFEAALGVDELSRSREIIRKRNRNAKYLTKILKEFSSFIGLPSITPGTTHAWMFYPIMVKNSGRDHLQVFLEEQGIQTRRIMPLTNQPVYKGWIKEDNFPVAKKVNRCGILLGCHHFLEKEDLDYIAKCFNIYFSPFL